jgi:hypothetical protein
MDVPGSSKCKLLFCPEDGDSRFLQNFGDFLSDYTVSNPEDSALQYT